jgi:lipopolysaccharide export LptBFGC system permease protein LptF
MPSEFPMNDPRNIWQNQPTEEFKMSADALRLKAQRSQSRARLEVLYSIPIGVVLCVFFARAFATAHEVIPRTGYALLSLWSIYFAYQTYKWIWPTRLARDTTLNTTLQSYISELEKRRDYLRHIWRRAGLTFCFLGMAMLMVPLVIKSLDRSRLMLNAVPVLVLFALWSAIFFPKRKRTQKKLQQEIDQLREFERENLSSSLHQ